MGADRGAQKDLEVLGADIRLDIIEEAIKTAIQRKRLHIPSGIIHVTDLTQCLRKTYYEVVSGYTKTKIMVAGEVMHSEILPQIAAMLELEGYSAVDEVEVNTVVKTRCMDIDLRGRIDLVVSSIPVEIKFSNRIMDHHILQAEYYAWMLSVSEYIICVIKDDGGVECKKFRRHIPDEELVKRVETLACAVLQHEPPKPEKGVWCNTCSFKHMCAATKKLSDYVF